MTVEFVRRGNLDTDRCTGSRPCEYEGRDQGDAAEAKESQRASVKNQELKR